MKTPSIPLTIVYKIVQVDSHGRMFSANPHYIMALENEDDTVIRYRLRHQVLPSDHCRALFACKTLTDAKVALDFYGKHHKCYILRGYAANVRDYARGDAVVEVLDNAIALPCSFQTVLCDWFIPIGIVLSNEKTPIDELENS